MEFTKEQNLFAQLVQKAWEDAEFKQELMANPKQAIERETGVSMTIPEGKTLVVRDQTDESTVFINIPTMDKLEHNAELSDAQLETVSAGKRLTQISTLSPLSECYPTENDDKNDPFKISNF